MAKLFSPDLEIAAVKSMARIQVTDATAYLFSTVGEQHLHYEPARAAFQRMMAVARKRGEVPTFDDLCDDPAIDEEFREVLRESEVKSYRTVKAVKTLFERLERYRKTRVLYQMYKEGLESLGSSKIDIDELLDANTAALTQARTSMQNDLKVRVIGAKGKDENLMREALTSDLEVLYKTGFTDIDERNGGMVAEGVHIIAATTSGGKSVVLQNLLYNIFKLNKVSVCNVSLEMQEHKLARRHGSMLTGIEFSKFVKREATDAEIDQADAAWRKIHRFGEKNDCRFGLVCPTFGVTMESLLMTLKPYGFKVIGIDYAGLLEGMSGDDQWKKLSEAVRVAKIWSSANHCLVIILAQLDNESNKIRYSKGMLEHADGCWTWNYSKPEVRDLRVLSINQEKARDQELFPFELSEEFHVMRVTNPSVSDSFDSNKREDDRRGGKESVTIDGRQPPDRGKKKPQHSKRDPLDDADDIAFDDDSGVK